MVGYFTRVEIWEYDNEDRKKEVFLYSLDSLLEAAFSLFGNELFASVRTTGVVIWSS